MSSGAYVLVAALVLASAIGLLMRRYSGHFRGAVGAEESAAAPERPSLSGAELSQLSAQLGQRATLVQFSSAFCAPCRATRRVLQDVAAMVPGVVHVEVDAERHLDLVRRLGVMRTPTTFVLDASGTVLTRASGQPRRADVIAALGKLVRE